MAKSKKTSDAFDMADDIRKEVAAETVADACSTSVPAIYSLAKGDNPRRAKFATVMPVPCPTMVRTVFVLPASLERILFSIRLSKAVALANRAIGMSNTK